MSEHLAPYNHLPTNVQPSGVAPITDFDGLIAVVTGGGTGMGRELTRQLAAAGARVAICDVRQEPMDETSRLVAEADPSAAPIVTFLADVADETAMLAFAAHVAAEMSTDHIHLLFNNAGIGGDGSIVNGDRAEWDTVFGVCWGGVLNGCRAFLPMLVAAERGHVVNTSSVNGMWACLGSTGAHTAYSAAKFAVRGFTEALLVDLRVNAPHVSASVVMPGHISTLIARNSTAQFGRDPKELTAEQLAELRDLLGRRGIDASGASDEDLRTLMTMRLDSFESDAPTSAADAAAIILDGVRSGQWRILIGQDAHDLDVVLRDRPHEAYSDSFTAELLGMGHFGGLIQG